DAVGVQVTGVSLMLLLGGTGYAIQAFGTAQLLGIQGVTLSGILGFERNTLPQDVVRTLTVGSITKTLNLAHGISRFGGKNVVISVLDQSLSGDFSFSQ